MHLLLKIIERNPMEVTAPINCTCFNLRKAARAVTQAYDKAIKPSGLRATQFTLLTLVSKMEPVGVKELASALVMDRTTLARNLKVLSTSGMIEIGEGDDRRYKPITITPLGKNSLELAAPLWEQTQIDLAKELGMDRWSNFLGDLNEVVNIT